MKCNLVILLILVTKCVSRCTQEYRNVQCDSVGDVESVDEQKEWTSLLIKSFGEQHKIEPSTFRKIPNVRSIIFNNSVNNIKDFSFVELSLHEMYFVNCDLPVIKKNWFSNSSIHRLQFKNSYVTYLEVGCFTESTYLSDLQLEQNNISRVIANVFSDTHLKYLFLDQNQIRFIEENAFANMTKLRVLSLEGNFLTSYNPKIIGGQVTSLLQLILENNQIQYLNKDSFVGLSNITYLYLTSNKVERIQDGAFNGLTQLKYLDLSWNKLESFSERAFPYNGLPSLETLFLHYNRLNYLSRSFVIYFPKLTKISIFGNPWQCGCYKEIRNSIYYNNISTVCSKEYLNGERPVCVLSETGSDECRENISNGNDLYEIYNEKLNEYSEVNSDNALKYCYVYSLDAREISFMKILFNCQFMCRVA